MADNIILTTDKNHVITSIRPEDETPIPFRVGTPIVHGLKSAERDTLMDIIATVQKETIVLDRSIELEMDGAAVLFSLYAFKQNHGMTVILSSKETECKQVIDELMRINNNLINQLRELNKQEKSDDEKAYEEISRLNSELLNSKRVIEKQHSKLKRYNELLHDLSIKDPLTDAYNRRHFYDYCRETLPEDHEGETLHLIMLDFNDFKTVNDTQGHDKGDALLKDFVDLVTKSLEGEGEIFRLGGDEFVILLFDSHPDGPDAFMRSVDHAFSRLTDIAGISWGILSKKAKDLADPEGLKTVMQQADKAMYADKTKKKAN